MATSYIILSLITAIANGYAAIRDFRKDPKILTTMERLSVPFSWLPALGILHALGSIGLIAGLFLPKIGLITAGALVLFFIAAIIAHLRVTDRNLGAAIFFLGLAAIVFALSPVL